MRPHGPGIVASNKLKTRAAKDIWQEIVEVRTPNHFAHGKEQGPPQRPAELTRRDSLMISFGPKDATAQGIPVLFRKYLVHLGYLELCRI